MPEFVFFFLSKKKILDTNKIAAMRSSVDFTLSLHIKVERQNRQENSQFLLNSLTEKVLRRLQLPFEGSKQSYLSSLQDLGALRKIIIRQCEKCQGVDSVDMPV